MITPHGEIHKALIIKKHWLDLILDGKKTWEMRSSKTHTRGKIALIESGTGLIKGTVWIKNSLPKIESPDEYKTHFKKHLVNISDSKTGNPLTVATSFPPSFNWIYPWELEGAVTWVRLDSETNPRLWKGYRNGRDAGYPSYHTGQEAD